MGIFYLKCGHMKQTFAIKFYCKESDKRKDGTAPVIVSLSVNGDRLQWQLPKKCKPKDFGKDQDIEIYCTSVKAKLNKIYTQLEGEGEAITTFKIKDIYINGLERRQSYTIKKLFVKRTKSAPNSMNSIKFITSGEDS